MRHVACIDEKRKSCKVEAGQPRDLRVDSRSEDHIEANLSVRL